MYISLCLVISRYSEDYRVVLQKTYSWATKAKIDMSDAQGFKIRRGRQHQRVKVKTESLSLSFWCLNPAVVRLHLYLNWCLLPNCTSKCYKVYRTGINIKWRHLWFYPAYTVPVKCLETPSNCNVKTAKKLLNDIHITKNLN